MKISARHLSVDLYNCKSRALLDSEMIFRFFSNLIETKGYRKLNQITDKNEEANIRAVFLFDAGHLTADVYPALAYVAVDVFLVGETSEPEIFLRDLRRFFGPDKVKTTLLKRGDFSGERDARPKIKTKVAPLKRIHNTGAKVIRILARKNRK